MHPSVIQKKLHRWFTIMRRARIPVNSLQQEECTHAYLKKDVEKIV
jgi:hypothetical protein